MDSLLEYHWAVRYNSIRCRTLIDLHIKINSRYERAYMLNRQKMLEEEMVSLGVKRYRRKTLRLRRVNTRPLLQLVSSSLGNHVQR